MEEEDSYICPGCGAGPLHPKDMFAHLPVCDRGTGDVPDMIDEPAPSSSAAELSHAELAAVTAALAVASLLPPTIGGMVSSPARRRWRVWSSAEEAQDEDEREVPPDAGVVTDMYNEGFFPSFSGQYLYDARGDVGMMYANLARETEAPLEPRFHSSFGRKGQLRKPMHCFARDTHGCPCVRYGIMKEQRKLLRTDVLKYNLQQGRDEILMPESVPHRKDAILVTHPEDINPAPYVSVVAWSSEPWLVNATRVLGCGLDIDEDIVPGFYHLALVGLDRNHHLKPLANALSNTKGTVVIEVFLEALKKKLGPDFKPPWVYLISDRAAGIIDSLKRKFPGIEWIPCGWHSRKDVAKKVSTRVDLLGLPEEESGVKYFRCQGCECLCQGRDELGDRSLQRPEADPLG
eukprot:Hpha_TRINITY_DN16474_c1_g2::TRINITY_DN16474_c1_g2_i4::g.160288::m.160288